MNIYIYVYILKIMGIIISLELGNPVLNWCSYAIQNIGHYELYCYHPLQDITGIRKSSSILAQSFVAYRIR